MSCVICHSAQFALDYLQLFILEIVQFQRFNCCWLTFFAATPCDVDMCRSGGIGRHARLRIWFCKEWEFKSPLRYQSFLMFSLSFYFLSSLKRLPFSPFCNAFLLYGMETLKNGFMSHFQYYFKTYLKIIPEYPNIMIMWSASGFGYENSTMLIWWLCWNSEKGKNSKTNVSVTICTL